MLKVTDENFERLCEMNETLDEILSEEKDMNITTYSLIYGMWSELKTLLETDIRYYEVSTNDKRLFLFTERKTKC